MTNKWAGLVDTHIHLDFKNFDRDRDQVIKRCQEANFKFLLNVGIDQKSNQKTIELAQRYQGFIYGSVGYHPHHADAVDGDLLAQLKKLATTDEIVAIGETGLDFYRNLADAAKQKRVFRSQIRLAQDLSKPLIIHSRAAETETLQILKQEGASNQKGVFHCFGGTIKEAEIALAMGFYLSFGGVITFPKAVAAREVLKITPLNRLLLETDCPFLTPQPYRGKRNEPYYVGYVAEKAASILEQPLAKIIAATTANANELFLNQQ